MMEKHLMKDKTMSEENKSSISDLLDSIESGNYNVSSEIFNDLLNDKIQTSLDAEKIAVAQDIFDSFDDDEEEDFPDLDEIDLDDDFDIDEEDDED